MGSLVLVHLALMNVHVPASPHSYPDMDCCWTSLLTSEYEGRTAFWLHELELPTSQENGGWVGVQMFRFQLHRGRRICGPQWRHMAGAVGPAESSRRIQRLDWLKWPPKVTATYEIWSKYMTRNWYCELTLSLSLSHWNSFDLIVALNYLREICISALAVNYPSMNVRLDCHFVQTGRTFFFQCTASTPGWIEDLFGKRGIFRSPFPTPSLSLSLSFYLSLFLSLSLSLSLADN